MNCERRCSAELGATWRHRYIKLVIVSALLLLPLNATNLGGVVGTHTHRGQNKPYTNQKILPMYGFARIVSVREEANGFLLPCLAWNPTICSHRLMARSLPSQGRDIGSNPLGNKLTKRCLQIIH